MNISALNSSEMIQRMFEVLKNTQDQAMDLSNKLLKVTVTQAVQEGIGENIDISV